jgi:hypothetical protein
MDKQTNIPKNFWLKWVMTNAIAWLVGFGILGNLVGGIPSLFGLLFGTTVGIAQVSSTEKRVHSNRWLIANIAGWTVGLMIATVTSRIPHVAFSGLSEPVFYILFGASGGICSATLQYFLQWRLTHHSYIWLPVLGVSNAIAGSLGGYVVWIAGESTLDSRGLIYIGGWIVGGALFGAITAFPMTRLQQSTSVVSREPTGH